MSRAEEYAAYGGIVSHEKTTGWRYPYDPLPKQALASSYDVDELLFGGAAGPGKDLALATPVLTRAGWSTQGQLAVGDEVQAPDGSWTTVVAAYPVEDNPCYAITFSTGETIVAGEGHLWAVRGAHEEVEILETRALFVDHHLGRLLRLPATRYDKAITVVKIVETATVPTRCVAVDHPEHLYLVGHTLIPTHNTDWALAEAVNTCLAVPNAKVLLLRNSFGELTDEIIPRLQARIPPWVGRLRGNYYTFANGSRIRLGYLERDDNKRRYIGAEYVLIVYDELTLMPWSAYEFLRSRVRATGQIARDLKKAGLRPRIIATSNPGGVSHSFVKQHFVDPAPPGTIVRDERSGLTRTFISATISDNGHMPQSYRRMLEALPPEKRKALLEGSWDILEGVRFTQWSRQRHVISPSELPVPPLSGQRVIAVDYGFSDPFSALFMIRLAEGLCVVYKELYARELTATQQAELIKEHISDQELDAGITIHLDPSAWRRDNALHSKTNDGTPPIGSPAYDYQKVLGQTPIKAINHRVHGASLVDEKLRVRPDGWPRLLVYDTCVNLIRTLPNLERGRQNPDDVASSPKQDDHAYDCLRYGLMALEPTDPTVRNFRKGGRSRPAGKFMTAGILDRKF